ncbi:MAG: hypothetical protein KJ666_17630 [Bacteroidetes bacterium]|nr:hypothetical protein [Bacteroidota bacterium]MBU2583890.1 hypothetical protein [Bacteroidota bacterium]
MSENTITLYPSNWLYNAGVVGLLNNLENNYPNENSPKNLAQICEDGTVIIDRNIFKNLNTKARFIEGVDKISIYRKGMYRNFLTTEDEKKLFIDFVKSLGSVENRDNCGLCNYGYYLPLGKVNEINNGQRSNKKFLNRIKEFNFVHNTIMGPTVDKFPNAFWNNKRGTKICHLCNFLILHHHIALTSLAFYEDIFINALSFKVMYELNKLIIETYGNMNREEAKNKREILATSVIEYSRKIKSTLGIWTGMNIEIVSKYKVKNEKGQWDDRIEYFSLPSDVIKIISDRGIASALSELGEFRILNIVLNRKYSDLIEIAYKLLRESTKDFDKRNKRLIDNLFYRWDNRKNLTQTANKILLLYTLIEEKIKRS